MIGNSKPKIIIEHKDTLMKSSQKFAEFNTPDFIIMKEAMLCFERIVLAQYEKSGQQQSSIMNYVTDQEK